MFRTGNLLTILILLPFLSHAQEIISSDADWPVNHVDRKNYSARKAPPPPSDTLNLPFFDDFSGADLRPDASLWENALRFHAPLRSTQKGIEPPNKGVITFDGASSTGNKYKKTLAVGFQDSLISKPIDLSTLNPGSGVYLSFFIEPGGQSEFPENTDSFYVYFDTSGNYDWQAVWKVAGDSLNPSRFTPVMIHLDTVPYFHEAFRFAFVSYGSLNGEFDVWHIDQVEMLEGRSPGDTIYNDQSIIRSVGSPFGDYTILPRLHYNELQPSGKVGVQVSNLNITNASRTAKIRTTDPDPVSGYNFLGIVDGQALFNYPAASHSADTIMTFFPEIFADPIAYELNFSFDNADNFPENDSLQATFRVDSVFAYDDGEADAGYGLSSSKGFCQRFVLADTSNDSLTAVWLNFVPSMHFNGTTQQSTCMEGQAFKLAFWTTKPNGQPDTLFHQVLAGMLISYGSGLNEYIRYPVTPGIRVPDTFFVGIRQNDEKSVGLGVDFNNDHGDKIFFQNQFFEWKQTSQLANATLMIRPEFGIGDKISGRQDTYVRRNIPVSIFPNPLRSELLNVRFQEVDVRTVDVELRDLRGRQVYSENSLTTENNALRINLQGLPEGIYVLSLKGRNAYTETVQARQKLVILRP